MTQARWGITVPFAGVPLRDHRPWFEELEDLGFTDVWSSEAGAHDAFTVLALAAAWSPGLRLGQAVIPVFTRGPALLAQSIASLVEAAPGRVAVGIGTSSNVIVERWNAMTFDKPYQRVRDTIRFLRAALSGEKVTEDYETFSVKGFRLGIPVAEQPPILVAALREGMLRLAGREGDGAIINWLSADDVKTVAPHVGPDKEIAARIFVFPTDDAGLVYAVGKRAIASYLTVPVYAAFHEWLGRGDQLADLWRLWKQGDRKEAAASIPNEVVDQLLVWGSPERCREHIQRYIDNGVTTPAPALFCGPGELPGVVRALKR
jgi:probable F420-dependent oxidoreductase